MILYINQVNNGVSISSSIGSTLGQERLNQPTWDVKGTDRATNSKWLFRVRDAGSQPIAR